MQVIRNRTIYDVCVVGSGAGRNRIEMAADDVHEVGIFGPAERGEDVGRALRQHRELGTRFRRQFQEPGHGIAHAAIARAGHDQRRTFFAGPLRESKVCDAIVVNMIDVGEETGDLDKMLIKIADNYDNDVDVLVGSLISILEPVMVVILGVIVGFIVIALFAPMISLIQSVSGGSSKK